MWCSAYDRMWDILLGFLVLFFFFFLLRLLCFFFFFFNDTATTEIYTLSLHDALPISSARLPKIPASSIFGTTTAISTKWSNASWSAGEAKGKEESAHVPRVSPYRWMCMRSLMRDRKSTRLNSSHANISYAVFCLKKKKETKQKKTKNKKKKEPNKYKRKHKATGSRHDKQYSHGE